MKKILILSALLMSFAANAGMKLIAPVTINLTNRTASGSMGDARNSADSVQYIECYATAFANSAWAECEASDAQGNRLQCVTTAAPIISLVQGIADGASIWFQADASGNCAFVQINRASWLRPPTP